VQGEKMSKTKVDVIGYGVIGQRLADGLADIEIGDYK
jgi:hypothetical protein